MKIGDFRSLASNYETLNEIMESNEDYSFGELRKNLNDYMALTVADLGNIDKKNEEISIPDYGLEFILENEAERRSQSSRPQTLEGIAVLGGVAGVLGSVEMFLENGEPAYLMAGVSSGLIGSIGAKRIYNNFKAYTAEERASSKLDMMAHIESYDMNIEEQGLPEREVPDLNPVQDSENDIY